MSFWSDIKDIKAPATKPNPLTVETKRELATRIRMDKEGTLCRAEFRATQWAAWKYQQAGHTVPSGTVGRVRYDYETGTQTVTFDTKYHVSGHWTTPNEPSYPTHTRGRKNSRSHQVWIDAHDEYDPQTPPISLPMHCWPVRWASRWHTAHQMGHTLADCAEFGQYDWMKKHLETDPVIYRADRLAERRLNYFRSMDDGASN